MAVRMRLDERSAPVVFERTLWEKKASVKESRRILGRFGGIFQKSDTPNANNRIYSRGLWEKVLKDKKVLERVKRRRMLGELDHPEGRRQTSLKEASHVITEIRLEKNGTVYGEGEVLDTPQGRILEALFDADVEPGISSRAEGEVEETDEGLFEVKSEGFELDTWDMVTDPSTPGAYPEQLTESQLAERQNAFRDTLMNLVMRTEDSRVVSETLRIFEENLSGDQRDGAIELCESRLVSLRRNTAMPGRQNESSEGAGSERLVEEVVETRVRERMLAENKTRDDRIRQLEKRILGLSEERDALRRKYDVAEGLLDEHIAKVEKLQERFGPRGASGERQAGSLQERYAKGVELLDESLNMLDEERRKVDVAEKLLDESLTMIEEERAKVSAAEQVIAEMLVKHDGVSKERAITECLSKLDEADRGRIKKILEKAPDAKTVREHFSDLKEALETRQSREPLPGGQRRRVQETREDREIVNESTEGDMIMNRIVGAVETR